MDEQIEKLLDAAQDVITAWNIRSSGLVGAMRRLSEAAQETADKYDNQTTLEKAAKKAATTGNRTDLQEYLKLRRE